MQKENTTGGVAFLCAKTRRFSRNRDLVCMAPPSIALLAPPGPTYAGSRARSSCFFIRIRSLRKEIRKSFFSPPLPACISILPTATCCPLFSLRSISRLSDTSLRAPVKERQGGTKYNRTFSRETTLRFPTRKAHCKKVFPFLDAIQSWGAN